MAINPLQQPINYSVDVQSPFAAAIEGMKFAHGQEELQAIRNKRQLEGQQIQAAQAQQQQFQSRVDSFFSRPPSERKFSELEPLLVGANKQQFDALKQIGTNMDADQLASAKKFTGQLLLSFEVNPENPENAKTSLRERIAIETDPIQKRAFQDILTIAETDPKEAARLVEENGAAAFGKPWYEGIEAARKGRRDAGLAESVKAKSVADAEAAVADASKKVAEAADTPARLKAALELKVAQGQEAQVKAAFETRNQLAALEKQAADLGLTNAQRGQVLASTKKLGIETKQAALALKALEASGGVDPDKKFTQEEKIRKEYQSRTKVFGELGTTFANIKSSADVKTGPGDIALITGFMKMLDPGSVVRETEFATARDTAGLFDRLLNTSQKLQSGQLFALDSKTRGEYVALAQQYLNSAEKKAKEEKDALNVVVKNYKLNPENVFGPETRTVVVNY